MAGIKSARELKKKYLEFFVKHGHSVVKSAPLVPENDPTVLFTTAGMHPLVPFLLGQSHPQGRRLCNVQKCIRTDDIDEVGDSTHCTFFEMLGNWSLGDYFKEDSIKFSFEFLTGKEWLNLPIKRIAVTCFEGDKDAPKDEVSSKAWLKLGIPKERIAFLPKKNNWWGLTGGGPCGPDTEIFYWVGSENAPEYFNPDDSKWVEIWNNVFMEFLKSPEGKVSKAKQQSVDTGMGTERVTAILEGKDDNYLTELFMPIIKEIEKLSGKSYSEKKNLRSMRIVADHMRASVFLLSEKSVVPSNVDQGYILRRLIRRVIRHTILLGISKERDVLDELAKAVINNYKEEYPELESNKSFIIGEFQKENERFIHTIDKGLKQFEKLASSGSDISAHDAFLLFQSFGFPIEMTQEMASERGLKVDIKGFNEEFEKHQELSRKGAEQKFKGGLADSSDVSKRLHTATHLLNEALRRVVSKDIKQRGSNITPERLRFDFSFDRKLTPEELKKVEALVNEKIKEEIPVMRKEMGIEEAKKNGAQAEFADKYGERVSVYSIGNFSKEVCGGPHVDNTREIRCFKIIKEEASAAGVRRIKAVVE